ncbi:NitT/TauT family transport system substrate-binding protein [Rhizobium petrolearium]|uniref:ABC transporter substrate-binding protein n=1 Tax=Neorhizobium petrolearium TaxID=515361 RepID=UPI001AE8CCAD|nr:ABC transporter substrate-binding protein [Neorhizobium petrolearium]MBP1845726.1 NitT/TauT family transport system substrate-binding protein [Neorhizobium petrolearium]
MSILKSSVIAGALIVLGGMLGSASAQEKTLKIGAAQTSAGSLPIIIADQKGLLKAEGLSYERFDFKGGGPAVQALASGSIDMCICAAEHAVRLQEQGLGGKVLVSLLDHHSYALLTSADSTAKSLADLKGQKIGITSAGSLTDTTMRYAIHKLGLDPDKDFQLIAVGRAGAQQAAIKAGVVAAGMFTTPDIQITLGESKDFKIVEDFRTLAYPTNGLIVTDGWLKENPETAAKVVHAVKTALADIQKDPTILTGALKELYPAVRDEAIIKQIVNDVATGAVSKDGVLSQESYTVLDGMLRAANADAKVTAYDDLVVKNLQ